MPRRQRTVLLSWLCKRDLSLPIIMAEISEAAIEQALVEWADAILGTLGQDDSAPIAFVGLISHGDVLARRLVKRLALAGYKAQYGAIDITLYRDDFSMQGRKPALRSSDLPFSTDGMRLILIDDVIQTGRTIRAALNAIFDYGRPACVELHCLVDRQGREIPVQPNYSAFQLEVPIGQPVKVSLQEVEGEDSICY